MFREPWLGAAVINSVIAIVVALGWRFLRKPQPKPAIIYYVPALVILFSSVALALSSRPPNLAWSLPSVPMRQLAWVLWIPIIEEWVFRGGLSLGLQKWLGTFTGSYLSALAFSFMHGFPTLERVFAGHMGFFLGPFILGLICDFLVIFSGSLRPAIAFHIVCNGTVIIFQWIDPRWLQWLRILYLHQ